MLAQTITTYAGNDAIFAGTGQQATAVQIPAPRGVAVDSHGNIFISSSALSMILRVAPGGVITVAAGNGLNRYAGDGGSAVAASLAGPSGLAFDQAGNLYVADSNNNAIRRIDPSGVITTVAGNGQGAYSGDGGPATSASLNDPLAVALDKSGNLYIAENDQRIRMVTPDGTISTIAGTGASNTGSNNGDGNPATEATLNRPDGLAFDAAGNLYVADQFACAVRKISAAGIITTVAGGKCGFSGDGGPATSAAISTVRGVALDSSGNLYLSDAGNQRIRRVSPTGAISTIAGTATAGFGGDGGAALQALFSNPGALALDSTGALIVIDMDNNRARRIVVGGAVNTVAGTTVSIGDSGPAPLASIPGVRSVSTDGAGNLYIAVPGQNRIRKVAPSGIIATAAGNGATAYTGDGGPAISASLNPPLGVASNTAGDLYIAEGNEIRHVNASTGKISTFAGTGACCYNGNGTGGDGGPATAAIIYYPESIAVDSIGNVYFTSLVQLPSGVDQGARVRRVTPDGTINVFAGGGFGFGGDNGPAVQALMGSALSVATGPDGSLYIADLTNNRVRRVDPVTGIITTVAGNGQSTPSGDGGPAISAGVPSPYSVAVDKANNLYIGCPVYVRKVTPAGTISTVAGNGAYNFAGDGGIATAAALQIATGLAVDAAGNLYLADSPDNRVRVVQAATATLAVSPLSLSFTSSGAGSQTFAVGNSGAGSMAWASSASTTSGGGWLSVSPASGSSAAGQTGATVTVTVNPTGLAAGDYYGSIQVTAASATNPVASVTVHLAVGATGAAAPQIASGGVLSTASYSLNAPLAPGMLVAIFGSNLTDAGQTYLASSFPWPTILGGTSVTIGGELLPLYVVTPGQINAMLPYDLAMSTTLPMVVTHGSAISAPEPVSIVAAQPGIYTATQNGEGTGIVVIAHPDGSQVLAGGSNAASPGDVLVIYCTGLGTIAPRGVAGAPVAYPPLSWADNTLTVTLEGMNAPVTFAGATPGYTGLYQVNATVPAGVAASSQASLILTQSGRSSPAGVTIPVQ
jgi:uncharacterized protein (TIGR03437 family)